MSLIENQGGGGGADRGCPVARAKPDGYTLLAGTTSELVISPVIMSTAVVTIRSRISCPGRDDRGLDLGADGARLRSRPRRSRNSWPTPRPIRGKLSYGSAGVGTSAHLCAELFKQTHRPARYRACALQRRQSGACRFLQWPSSNVRGQYLAAGARHAPARTKSACWWPAAPSVWRARQTSRSASEVGFPELITVQFMGVFAPGATPTPDDRQARQTRRNGMMADKDVQKRLIRAGFEPMDGIGPGRDRVNSCRMSSCARRPR